MRWKVCDDCETNNPPTAENCRSCDSPALSLVEMTPTIEEGAVPIRQFDHVVCKRCGAFFNRGAQSTCPECDRVYVPDASELLPPRTAAQREAIAHAERVRTQFQAQERLIAEAQLTTTRVYRPLPVWRQRLFAFARGIRTWVTKTRGRKDRTP